MLKTKSWKRGSFIQSQITQSNNWRQFTALCHAYKFCTNSISKSESTSLKYVDTRARLILESLLYSTSQDYPHSLISPLTCKYVMMPKFDISWRVPRAWRKRRSWQYKHQRVSEMLLRKQTTRHPRTYSNSRSRALWYAYWCVYSNAYWSVCLKAPTLSCCCDG